MAEPHGFGRYRVTKTLGAGAMGEVYEAVDEVLGREVAIKTLKTSSGITARVLDDRFRHEARAIAQLSHPGIVQLFDIALDAQPPYLVMERVAGPSLAARLAGGPLPVEDAITLGIQVARALAAAHAAGIVHRDVKPANILAAGPGAWKLADFGVAHVPDSSLTITGQFVGSPAYAPPEALVQGAAAPASDVFGLGATLYEAVSGRWPRAERGHGLLAPVPPLRQLVPHVPERVAAAIDRAVAIEAAERPSATEVAELLAGTTAPAPELAGGPAAAMSAAQVPAASLSMSAAQAPAAAMSAAQVPAASAAMSAAQVPAASASSAQGPVASAAASASAAHASQAARWRPWLIGGAVVLAIGLLVAARGGRGPARPPLGPPGGDPAQAGAPGDFGAQAPAYEPEAPPDLDDKGQRDWDKVLDELDRGHAGGARHKLDDFERRYGESDATRALRQQLDDMPDEPPHHGHGHGPGKHHDEDD